MRIYCPECYSCYEVDEALLPDKGKKLRCSLCGEIFVAKQGIEIGLKVKKKAKEKEKKTESPIDNNTTSYENGQVENSQNESSDNSSVSDENVQNTETEELSPEEKQAAEFEGIFSRLSKQTEELFADESKLPFHKKLRRKIRNALGLNQKKNQYMWMSGLALVFLLCMYSWRYDVVRAVPFMNGIYKVFGVNAKIPGEGLEFENIVWQDYEEDYVRQLEIRGFISNPTDRDIRLPVLHIEMLTKDTSLLQSKNEVLPASMVKAGGKVAIAVKLKKPSILTKYIYMTFIEKEDVQ